MKCLQKIEESKCQNYKNYATFFLVRSNLGSMTVLKVTQITSHNDITVSSNWLISISRSADWNAVKDNDVLLISSCSNLTTVCFNYLNCSTLSCDWNIYSTNESHTCQQLSHWITQKHLPETEIYIENEKNAECNPHYM